VKRARGGVYHKRGREQRPAHRREGIREGRWVRNFGLCTQPRGLGEKGRRVTHTGDNENTLQITQYANIHHIRMDTTPRDTQYTHRQARTVNLPPFSPNRSLTCRFFLHSTTFSLTLFLSRHDTRGEHTPVQISKTVCQYTTYYAFLSALDYCPLKGKTRVRPKHKS